PAVLLRALDGQGDLHDGAHLPAVPLDGPQLALALGAEALHLRAAAGERLQVVGADLPRLADADLARGEEPVLRRPGAEAVEVGPLLVAQLALRQLVLPRPLALGVLLQHAAHGLAHQRVGLLDLRRRALPGVGRLLRALDAARAQAGRLTPLGGDQLDLLLGRLRRADLEAELAGGRIDLHVAVFHGAGAFDGELQPLVQGGAAQ